jgi:hypothetical protein
VAAAASCCSLEQLDLSSTGLTDAALKPLTHACSSSWISRGAAAGCRGLRRLALGGNCRLSGAAVGQLGRAMAAGGQMAGLTELSLAGCASVGDEGEFGAGNSCACCMVILFVQGWRWHYLSTLLMQSCVIVCRCCGTGSCPDCWRRRAAQAQHVRL